MQMYKTVVHTGGRDIDDVYRGNSPLFIGYQLDLLGFLGSVHMILSFPPFPAASVLR